MPSYTAPTRDTKFVVNEVLDLAGYGNLPGFESATPDLIDAVIDECGKFCCRGPRADSTRRATAKAARATPTVR